MSMSRSSASLRGLALCTTLSLLLAGLCAPVRATSPAAEGPAEWAMFHADPARSGVAAVDFRSPPDVLLWTFDLGPYTRRYCEGASVWSSNAVAGEVEGRTRVFVGAYDHNLYCLDALTGVEQWRYTTGCLITSAPVFAPVHGRPMVFVASADRSFHAVDARDGRRVWTYETYPWTYTVGESRAGSPLLVEIEGRATLIATMWNSDKRALRTVQRGETFAIEAATGRLLWRRVVSTSPLTSPAWIEADDRHLICVGSEDGTLYALDAADGSPVWAYTTGRPIRAAPSAGRIGGQPVVFVGNRFGMVRCLSALTGEEIWSYKTGHEVLSTPALGRVKGTPVLFVGSSDRRLHALRASMGTLAWKFETQKYVVSSPAVAAVGGRTVVCFNSLDNGLYVVDAETGAQLFKFESGDMLWPYETRGISLWSSPSVVRAGDTPVLLFPAHDGKLYAFTYRSRDAATGEQEQRPVPAQRRTVPLLPPAVGLTLIVAGLCVVFLGPKEETS